MPMFDDPDRELSRLQRQLLDEEQELEELMDEYGEADFEECFQEDYEDETRDVFFRNHANGYGADIRNFANGYRGEALLEEEEDEGFEEYEGKHHRCRSARGLMAVVIFAALAYFVLRRMGLW